MSELRIEAVNLHEIFHGPFAFLAEEVSAIYKEEGPEFGYGAFVFLRGTVELMKLAAIVQRRAALSDDDDAINESMEVTSALQEQARLLHAVILNYLTGGYKPNVVWNDDPKIVAYSEKLAFLANRAKLALREAIFEAQTHEGLEDSDDAKPH